MADSFDIVDIVFDAVEAAKTNFILYKSNSITGEKNNHITVAPPPLDYKTVVNKAPFVNINIFVQKFANGLINYQLMKTTCRAVEKSLKENIVIPEGMYWKSRIVWSQPMGEYKKDFDCTNIRLEVITQKK